MASSIVTNKDFNGYGMMIPPLPLLPMQPCLGWGNSTVSTYPSIFTPMPLFTNVSNTAVNYNNKNAQKTLDNNKSKFSFSNMFSNIFSMPMTFIPTLPPLPKFDFKFIKPSNIFSVFKSNKKTKKTHSSHRNYSARTIAPRQTTSISEVAKIYNAKKGVKLAQKAIAGLKNAQTGYCARAVKTAICGAGLGKYESGHAYQCPDSLRRNPNFKEVKVKGSDLKKLPAGCILAYNRSDAGYSSLYGHIEIKGQGNQAIHFTVNNNIKPSDNVRVFVPV